MKGAWVAGTSSFRDADGVRFYEWGACGFYSSEVSAEERLGSGIVVACIVGGSEILIRGDQFSELGFPAAVAVA